MKNRYNTCFKIEARRENMELYRHLTGQQSIPVDREYWTLCASQEPIPESEIEQYVAAGFLTREQFHGVDQDGGLIQQNRLWHPTAQWYHGDWQDVIQNANWNPALIYMDSTSMADHRRAAQMLITTLTWAPSDAIILANVMLNDPRSSRWFDINRLIEEIEKCVPERLLNRWDDIIPNYTYSATGRTMMNTLVFSSSNRQV